MGRPTATTSGAARASTNPARRRAAPCTRAAGPSRNCSTGFRSRNCSSVSILPGAPTAPASCASCSPMASRRARCAWSCAAGWSAPSSTSAGRAAAPGALVLSWSCRFRWRRWGSRRGIASACCSGTCATKPRSTAFPATASWSWWPLTRGSSGPTGTSEVSVETKVTRVMQIEGLAPKGADEACLVEIYGPTLGRKFTLAAVETIIGRGETCEIVLELDNVSRKHCSLLLKPDGVFLRDNGSTNGTYLNSLEVRGETPLRSGDLIKVGGAIFKFLFGGELGSIEAQYHEEIYRLTIIDGLTQVYNKRYLLEFLEREMARCLRHQRDLSLVIFDIDHFKKINDTFGHLAGDYCLRELASALKSRIRKEECFARYGGEEFA